jgi:hypothetical protein
MLFLSALLIVDPVNILLIVVSNLDIIGDDLNTLNKVLAMSSKFLSSSVKGVFSIVNSGSS